MCGSGADGFSRTASLNALTAISRCPRSICVDALLERAARPRGRTRNSRRPRARATSTPPNVASIHTGNRRGGATTLIGPVPSAHVRNRFHLAGDRRRTARRTRAGRGASTTTGSPINAASSFRNGLARRIDVGVGRTIARRPAPIVHRLKFGERIRLIEVDQLTLPRFANERLAGEDACFRRATRSAASTAIQLSIRSAARSSAPRVAVQPRNGSARRIESRRAPDAVPPCSPNDPEQPRYGATADETLRVVGRNANSGLAESVLRRAAHELFAWCGSDFRSRLACDARSPPRTRRTWPRSDATI